MKDLSVVVVSYNTKALTLAMLESLYASFNTTPELTYEVIIVDNASSDGSIEAINKVTKKHPGLKLVKNKKNLGFGAANNIGIKMAKGKNILLLNTDVIVKNVNFQKLVSYLHENPKVGALTVRVELSSGSIDPASHRGFPTIWRSFCFFSGLEQAFKDIPFLSKVFGGYHLTHLPLDTIHEIDAPAAAFYLTRKDIMNEINGFDEDYFMYGEDVDMSYRIKRKGYSIEYYPIYTILHLKHQSGLKKESNSEQRSRTKKHFYEAMQIFYDKHYAKGHSSITNTLVRKAIRIKSQL